MVNLNKLVDEWSTYKLLEHVYDTAKKIADTGEVTSVDKIIIDTSLDLLKATGIIDKNDLRDLESNLKYFLENLPKSKLEREKLFESTISDSAKRILRDYYEANKFLSEVKLNEVMEL